MAGSSNKTEEEQIREQIASLLKGFSPAQENLVPILQAVQAELGFIPQQAITDLASFLAIAPGEIFGVATFFNQFRFIPPGKHPVKVCLGTACHVRGATIILEEWERRLEIKEGAVTEDREFSLDRVACVGCCALAPVALVGDDVHGKMSPSSVNGILLKFEIEKKKQEKDSEQE